MLLSYAAYTQQLYIMSSFAQNSEITELCFSNYILAYPGFAKNDRHGTGDHFGVIIDFLLKSSFTLLAAVKILPHPG
jgi:hypothetical protein